MEILKPTLIVSTNEGFGINTNRDKVVKQYLESLVWTFNYYFSNIISWDWFYEYQYGPLTSDIVGFLENNRENSKRFKIAFDINKLTKIDAI